MLLNTLLQTTTTDPVFVADSAKVKLESLAQSFAENPNQAISDLISASIQFGLKVLAAIAIYIIGAWIIRRTKNLLRRVLNKKNTEPTLTSFVMSLVSIGMTVMLVIITISTLGINTTSIAALLAAGGMAIGMALSGTVQNFAGGIMILLFKPFKTGDFISAQGFLGTVKEVTIVSTSIVTTDNRVIVLPNGALSNGNIDNYSKNPLRRVDWNVGFEYGIDAQGCIDEIISILREDPRILDSTTQGALDPFAAVSKLNDSSVDFVIRAWVKAEDYWDVFFDFNKNVYTEMPKRGYGFPFPQMDVHLKSK